jgi:molecular chaperone DnaJ
VPDTGVSRLPPMAQRDYYEVLGVPRSAADGEIKKSFRRLARELHPDLNPGDPEAAERFREAAEAYEALSDPDKRARYDRFGHAGLSGAQFHTDQFMDFGSLSDLLGAFFGDDLFGGGRRGPARGQDVGVAVDIAFTESASGLTRAVEYESIVGCERCGGSGAEPGTAPEACDTCGGAGRVQRIQQTALGQFVQTAACPTCRGRGVIISEPCSECRGQGRHAARQTVDVQIPAGIMDGQRIHLRGRGGAAEPGGQPGDLYVVVRVAADPRFERDGDDVVSLLDVPFTQAALGASLTVETLDGELEVELPAGTQPDDVLVLRDRGIPHLRGRGRGDHRIVINVLVPRKLDDAQRRLLEEFDRTAGAEAYARDESLLGRLRAALR